MTKPWQKGRKYHITNSKPFEHFVGVWTGTFLHQSAHWASLRDPITYRQLLLLPMALLLIQYGRVCTYNSNLGDYWPNTMIWDIQHLYCFRPTVFPEGTMVVSDIPDPPPPLSWMGTIKLPANPKTAKSSFVLSNQTKMCYSTQHSSIPLSLSFVLSLFHTHTNTQGDQGIPYLPRCFYGLVFSDLHL